MTFNTVTTGRFGSLHRRLNREACKWVSRHHRPSSPHQCLPVRFVKPIVADDSFSRLKPRAISGEIPTPTGTRACEMRLTETGNDAVFTHSAPHSDSCAALPPDEDVPHRTNQGHFTIAAKTSPAPTASVGLKTGGYPPLSHRRPRARFTVQRRANSRLRRPHQRNGRQSTRILITHQAQLPVAGACWHGFRRLRDDLPAGLTVVLPSPTAFRRGPTIVSVYWMSLVRNQDRPCTTLTSWTSMTDRQGGVTRKLRTV